MARMTHVLRLFDSLSARTGLNVAAVPATGIGVAAPGTTAELYVGDDERHAGLIERPFLSL